MMLYYNSTLHKLRFDYNY